MAYDRRELGDETLKKIAHELAESLRRNVSVDWAVRDSVRAKLRLLVKRILRKYKYPPVKEEAAVALVLEQAETLSATVGVMRDWRRTVDVLTSVTATVKTIHNHLKNFSTPGSVKVRDSVAELR